MTLSYTESEVVEYCAGGLLTFGSYVGHYPDREEDLTAALLDELGADERATVIAVAERLKEKK